MKLMLVEIETPAQRTIYRHLSQPYEAEFSPLTGKWPDAQGLYAITELPQAGYRGWLWLAEGPRPVGFAVVGRVADRWDVAEFYVVPGERQRQVGSRMAQAIFMHQPGPWQVRQIPGADGARCFWRRGIADYTAGHYRETEEADPDWGWVTVQRFLSPPAVRPQT